MDNCRLLPVNMKILRNYIKNLYFFVQGIIGRVSQYAEYIIEPPEDSDETESDSESEIQLPNRVSQFEANIFEQMTQQAYDGEILSGERFDIKGFKRLPVIVFWLRGRIIKPVLKAWDHLTCN